MSDEERLEALLTEHYRFLWRMVARELWSRHLPVRRESVGDVVSHVLEIVHRQWVKGKAQEVPPEGWGGWLTTIARNQVNNVVRQADRRRVEVPLHDGIPHPRSHDEDYLLARLSEPPVRAMIAALDEPERSVLDLMVWDGMKPGEAAVALGIDPETAARAMRSLSDKVSRLLDGGTVKGDKAAGVREFTRMLTMFWDRGDGRG